MRSAKQDLLRRKGQKNVRALKDMLSGCDDRGFLQLAWSINMLQSSFGADVTPFLTYPIKAATPDMGSEFAVRKWEIETMLATLLATPKKAHRQGVPLAHYRLDKFDTMATAVNYLRHAEDYQSGDYLNDNNIMLEMSRIAQRQFGWQRGFASTERLYRYVFVYGQGNCAAYFADRYGMSIKDFLKVGFYLFTQLHRAPWAKPVAIEGLGVDVPLIERALPLVAKNLTDIRAESARLIGQLQGGAAQRMAYFPSVLRRYPVIRDASIGKYIAPLPQLVMFRMTAGLYYDFASGPQQLITEANARFEQYVRQLVEAYLPRFRALPSHRFGPKKAKMDSPDVLVQDGDQIVAIMECKATKLTYEAQFADDPMEAAKNAFGQIVKGIAQLWRFFSRVRRGVYDGPVVSPQAHAILLTMDAWMQMADMQRDQAILAARNLIVDEPEVTGDDQRPIIFCSMQDLADVMIVSDEDQFLLALDSAKLDKYKGWDFRQVRRDAAGQENGKTFPFDVGELLPWWNTLQQAQQGG